MSCSREAGICARGPGADYFVAGVVHDGEALARVKMDGWIPVIYKGEVRYISERAVKEK